MTTPTLTTIPDLLHALRDAAPEYPPALLASRREAFIQSLRDQQADSDGLWMQLIQTPDKETEGQE